jgi:hypothetical protein
MATGGVAKMEGVKSLVPRRPALILIASLLLVPFQNCTNEKKFSSTSSAARMSGNGGSYDGKPDVYRHFDGRRPCLEKDGKGAALPNDVIVLRAGSSGKKAAFLARETCRDIEPAALSASDLAWSSATEFTYRNQSFSDGGQPGDFDVAAPACPIGKTPKAAAAPVNEFLSSLNWTQAPWQTYQGIGTTLFGTIGSLPSYKIERNDPALLDDWRRVDQEHALSRNTEYAYSFVAQPGTTQAADWIFFRNVSGSTGTVSDPRDESALITFDFAANTTRIIYSQNITNVRATMVPLANGYHCTVYFTTTAAVNPPETAIGVTPSLRYAPAAAGDSIRAANAILVPVNQLCE